VAFRENGYSKKVSFLIISFFGLMSPAGAYLANSVPLIMQYSAQINAVVIGIFLHISTTILFESSSGHKFNSAKLIVITIATALVYFSY
ncbi:MAG: ZIP family metal transporter, partial [Flavobacteriales bacterium]|nr:ZIP family metal transporter [Flavobacteriales bacterium]